MQETLIRLWPALKEASIRPEIYGHLAEHVGRSVYEGVWVGEESRLSQDRGMRLDVIAALKHLRAPLLKWPGGPFAEDYHWRDGLGDPSRRPARANIWWRQGEPNHFGTNEFLSFCRAIGCAPCICCNMATGSPRESRDWVEYCNFGGESFLSRLRASHGQAEPYGAPYWSLGYESWGKGGGFSAVDYAQHFSRHAAAMKAMDPTIELIACGKATGFEVTPDRWNQDCCEHLARQALLDHLSIPFVLRADSSAQAYGPLFERVRDLEAEIERTDALLRYFFPEKKVGIALNAWGLWREEATVENGLEQPYCLGDALMAASVLNLLNRWARRVTMANIAQAVNVLQCLARTEGHAMTLTPTYYVFDMMRAHMGADLIRQELVAPGKAGAPQLSISASRAGKRLLLTVVNQSLDTDITARIEIHELGVTGGSGRILVDQDPCRSLTSTDRIRPKRLKLNIEDGSIHQLFPAHSFSALSLSLG